jgi:predicted glycogen debranching enzyme
MSLPIRRVPRPSSTALHYASREWLVTNGLGGYASGTVSGVVTRRYHGLLVAALPAPFGRLVMLSHLHAHLHLPSGRVVALSPAWPDAPDDERGQSASLTEFRLEVGLPVWRYEIDGIVIERRVLMPYRQNSVHLTYRLIEGPSALKIDLRPFMHVRHYGSPLSTSLPAAYTLTAVEGRFEVHAASDLPPLRLFVHSAQSILTLERLQLSNGYLEEHSRGYEHDGTVWSPGYFSFDLVRTGAEGTLVASTESWDVVSALTPGAAYQAEVLRSTRLLEQAPPEARMGVAAELVLAADQFVITPAARPEDAARAVAVGTEARTVIAGYHWFTDWGRDTMISLDGLTLATGRHREAALILQTFAGYVREGLIPNMFPDGQHEGLYHTADATLWFFHAIDRYVTVTGDRDTLRALLPVLRDILDHHLRGTRFGIGVDPADGLLRQGAEGYQLTWMDAKVDGWVVTPRRGKAVEINALFYNALRLLEGWVREEEDDTAAAPWTAHADRAQASFNRRFWYDEGQHLFDVIDGESGDDTACRPNQIVALSLRHAVIDECRWRPVFNIVRERLLTPYGLRSLAPGHPDYCRNYHGDLRARDAAYHQGTVWAWLIGPFVDAWLRVAPMERDAAHAALQGFERHLNEAGIGSISEIFDAEPPYTPRGCIAQAWSVAELLRVWLRTQPVTA